MRPLFIPFVLFLSMLTTALNAEERKVFDIFRCTRGQSVSAWAAENVILDAKESSRPGKYDPTLTPYLNGIMDAFTKRGVEFIVVLKAARVGGNVAGNACLGWAVANDPGPAQLVKPTEPLSDKNILDRVLPFLQGIPATASHLTDRVGKKQIVLDNMVIRGGWASAPSSLKADSYRYEFLDEVDDYAAVDSGDPVQLAIDRTTSYTDLRKVVIWSTPKTQLKPAWREWELCPVHYAWWVPCPHCGAYQVLDFDVGMDWKKDAPPSEIWASGLAWYVCAANKCRIDNSHQAGMNARGRWVSEHEKVHADGSVTGTNPPTNRIGFQVGELVSPFVPWGQTVAEYLQALGDPLKMQVWTNQKRGRPYVDQVGTANRSELERRAGEDAPPAGVVPLWCGMLLAAADVQADHCWYVIRALGADGRSRLIAYGRVDTFVELPRGRVETWELLLRSTLNAAFPTEGPNECWVSPQFLAIDSGGGLTSRNTSRTEEVYAFAQTNTSQIIAYKGDNGRGGAEERRGKAGIRNGKYSDIMLRMMQPDFFKDRVNRKVRDQRTDPVRWELNQAVKDDYLRQMVSEHKVRHPRTGDETWEKRSQHTPNHLWDCEVLLEALAYWKCAHLLTEADAIGAGMPAAPERRPPVPHHRRPAYEIIPSRRDGSPLWRPIV